MNAPMWARGRLGTLVGLVAFTLGFYLIGCAVIATGFARLFMAGHAAGWLGVFVWFQWWRKEATR